MKSILRPVLAVLTMFLGLSLISCQGNGKSSTNALKYTLIEYENFTGKVDVEKIYNYYYIEFKENGEFAIYYNMKDKNIDLVELGSYTKTENMYVVNANGMTLNYIIYGNKLECDLTIVKFILELEE